MKAFRVNGKTYTGWEQLAEEGEEELAGFLREWFGEQEYVMGHTSGSTGQPKTIRLNKADMRASAHTTNRFFHIGRNSVLLLCLSVSYIAGKMMVVRALEADAELLVLPVSSHPLAKGIPGGRTIDLAAMVPMQVEQTLKIPVETACFRKIRQLIIGGAPVAAKLEVRLKILPVSCYATYGMTETVSHVALRMLNRDRKYFALGEVTFTVDERQCLIIHTPHLRTKQFVTNDMVRLYNDRQFEWLGRWDNVINSGGIKFFPELIEHKMEGCLEERFFITSQPDDLLGQRIVLVIEMPDGKALSLEVLKQKLKGCLTPYEMPREVFFCRVFSETTSGKMLRTIPPGTESCLFPS